MGHLALTGLRASPEPTFLTNLLTVQEHTPEVTLTHAVLPNSHTAAMCHLFLYSQTGSMMCITGWMKAEDGYVK